MVMSFVRPNALTPSMLISPGVRSSGYSGFFT
jgi:hypothetical protein